MGQFEAVVVVHGLWLPGIETWVLRRRLERAGFNAYLFRYRSVSDSLKRNSELLLQFVDRLSERKVHVLGYSLGGVVSACMLQDHHVERIGRLVCLASPLNGSASALALSRLPGGSGLLGRTATELAARGGLDAWHGATELGIVAGDIGVGLGRILGALEGPNDGTVAVAETRLEGASDHVVRHVSHFSMLFSGRVADDALRFIRNGTFDRQSG